MPIDYSKFEHIGDSDEEPGAEGVRKPRMWNAPDQSLLHVLWFDLYVAKVQVVRGRRDRHVSKVPKVGTHVSTKMSNLHVP